MKPEICKTFYRMKYVIVVTLSKCLFLQNNSGLDFLKYIHVITKNRKGSQG